MSFLGYLTTFVSVEYTL